MYYNYLYYFLSQWSCPKPEPELVGLKDQLLGAVGDFISSANCWNFYHKKVELLHELESLLPDGAPPDVVEEFLHHVDCTIGNNYWYFKWCRSHIQDELEQKICDLTDPGGPLAEEPEETIQLNLTPEDDFFEVPDNAAGIIAGNRGDDEIIGNRFDDFLGGNGGNDTIFAGEGNDEISGGADDDVIDGGKGADTIRGGRGEDTVTGGEGADTFETTERTVGADEFDFVTDFDASEGDVFLLTGIDAMNVSVVANTMNAANVDILVGGELAFIVQNANAAEVQAALTYDIA